MLTVLETPWSTHALDLVEKRYLSGYDLTIDEWLTRVSQHISQFYPEVERKKWEEQYFRLISSRTFLPTSACLHNSLRGQGSLAGCTVLPLPSETLDIFETALPQIQYVLLHGTGVGLDLSILPPRLMEDEGIGRAYPGPVEVLSAIVLATDGIMVYAGFKRAAFMASLYVNHPDIFEFIQAKSKRHLRNVNISVAVDEKFIAAVENEGLLPLTWNHKGIVKHLTANDLDDMHRRAVHRAAPAPDLRLMQDGILYSETTKGIVGREKEGILHVDAKKVMEAIARLSHECGDPGILNMAAINEANPTHPRYANDIKTGPAVGEIHVTTPCGEQPLLPYEVCHLGSFNLTSFLKEGYFNFDKLIDSVKITVRFMDDVVEVGDNGLDMSNMMARANRKIGIGVMGLADVLAEIELPYDSEEGRAFASKIVSTIQKEAVNASRELAVERGAFEAFEHSVFYSNGEPPRRHATLTTIAPTGHISMLADCSTSIEPYFLVTYSRDAAGLRIHTCPRLDRKLKEMGYNLDQWISATQAQEPGYTFDGTLAHLTDTPTLDASLNTRLGKLKRIFRTAHEITPIDHLKMVAGLQQFVENGISKTINLPNEATVEEVYEILKLALGYNLKGITVFRDGCLSQQALSRVDSCPSCGETKYLRPNDCGALSCSSTLGGCGYEGACSL